MRDWIRRYRLGIVLAVALVIRVGVLLAFPGVFNFEQTGAVHGSDAYDAYAQNLLETGVYGRTPGDPDALIPPGYSYALAAVYGVLGRGGLQVGLFHTALDLLTISLLYRVGVRLFGRDERARWIAAGAALFYAGYPYLVFQNLTLIDTPLFMTVLYVWLWLVVLLRERESLDGRTWALATAAGAVLGVGMLVRPIWPPLAILVAVWFLFRRSFWQTVAWLAPVALIGVAVVLGWTARNVTVYEQFVPLTTTSGANFWQGNNPLTVPYFRAGYDVQWTSPELGDAFPDKNSPDADAERFRLASEHLSNNPADIPELLWVKFRVHWSIDIAPRRNPTAGEQPRLNYEGDALIIEESGEDFELGALPEGDPVDAYSQPLFDRVGRALHRVYFGGLFALSLLGMAVTAREWRQVSLLWFVQISMTIIYMAFHPSTRYRAPTDPLLFLFSAAALWWLWQQRRAAAL